MRTRTNESPELDIPPEAAETIGRARAMQADGWAALADMGDAELDEFEREVDASYVFQDWDPVHPHNALRLTTLSAITDERSRRRREAEVRSRNAASRASYIREAAEHVAKAAELVEAAYGIPEGWPNAVPEPPALDVEPATDGELDRTASACRAIIAESAGFNRSPHELLAEQAAAIGQLKGKAAREISAELAGRASRYAERLEAARLLLALILAEQEKRSRERAEVDQRLTPAALNARIAELEKQVAGKAGE